MDMNGGAAFGETPGGAGMIKMNVADENVPDIFRIDSDFLQTGGDIRESRFRPGIKQGDTVIRFERSGGDDAGPAKLQCVDYMNLQSG